MQAEAVAHVPAALDGLAKAIEHYLRPRVEPLLGVAPHTPASATVPPPGVPCWCCGAIRDERGRILWARMLHVPTGLRTTRPTGIQEGDRLACIACQCLAPSAERRAPRRGQP